MYNGVIIIKNNLITKIALGVAPTALVFSIMLYTIRGAEAEEDFAEEHTAKEEPKPEEAVRAFSDEPEENGAEELKNDDFSLEKKYNWSNFE